MITNGRVAQGSATPLPHVNTLPEIPAVALVVVVLSVNVFVSDHACADRLSRKFFGSRSRPENVVRGR
jgi:hypothetical protein